jgi:biopolymer transport protein ExbB/TolQ
MLAEGEAAPNAFSFAITHATTEGKMTMCVLVILSLFSWTIIITKARQLMIACKWSKKFLELYNESRDPMEIRRKGDAFEGAPCYQLYIRGADELDYQLKHNPVKIKGQARISGAAFEAVKVVMEEAAGAEAMSLEKGMIVLSTAVAGGPFIGLLGTVWGVMSTFAGIAAAHSASLTTMAPGVAAALIATVVGLLVAIPAMFAYNFMVTTVRTITQELDGFASRYANQIEHAYVDNRPLAEEIAAALAGYRNSVADDERSNEPVLA